MKASRDGPSTATGGGVTRRWPVWGSLKTSKAIIRENCRSHDGFHMDLVQGGSVPPKALVQFENGMSLLVDNKMKWEKLTEE